MYVKHSHCEKGVFHLSDLVAVVVVVGGLGPALIFGDFCEFFLF